MHGVLVAVFGDLEPDVVAHLSKAPGLTVERRCADVAELLAAAGARVGTVAVVSASFFGIDHTVIDRLHAMGVSVVGIAQSEDIERVAALRCDAVTDAAAGGAAVVEAIERLDLDDFVPPPPEAEPDGDPPGLVVTLWGPHGAPGRTTMAAALAMELSYEGTVLLVDADTIAPSLAQALGIVDETSGIAAACRAASNGRLDATTLQAAAATAGRIRVLTGLTRPDRWREVPGRAVEDVLHAARAAFDWIVVDVAGGWEDDDSDYGSAFAPTRWSAQHAALGAADHVVILGEADAVGMYRLVSLLVDAPRVEGRYHVAVNKLRSSATGTGSTHQVREVLARLAGEGDPVLIAHDAAAADSAMRMAEPLAVAVPDSKAMKGVRELAGRIIGHAPTRRAIRKRRKAEQ